MKPTYLDDEVIGKVVQYFKSFMTDETVAPGEVGKRAFFQNAVIKIDFLPEPIQRLIDQNRVNTSQSDYLLLHPAFNMEFSKYIP